jgi:hypothetical protein
MEDNFFGNVIAVHAICMRTKIRGEGILNRENPQAKMVEVFTQQSLERRHFDLFQGCQSWGVHIFRFIVTSTSLSSEAPA